MNSVTFEEFCNWVAKKPNLRQVEGTKYIEALPLEKQRELIPPGVPEGEVPVIQIVKHTNSAISVHYEIHPPYKISPNMVALYQHSFKHGMMPLVISTTGFGELGVPGVTVYVKIKDD